MMGTDTVFANIAKSITPYFRIATNGTAEGLTQELELYIHARRQFLLIPVVMVI